MLIILNLSGGLCNQISDLFFAINYLQFYNIKFSVNSCSFRDD